jgi:hypothetical protein
MDQKTTSTDASPLSLKEVPNLPLRAGRHLTAWVRWHTARVHTEDRALGSGPADGTLRSKQPS